MKQLWEHIKIFLSGVLMTISDAVPGFSGGIALTITNKLHEVWNTWEKIKKPKEKGDRSRGIIFYVVFISGSVIGTFGFAQIIKLMLDYIPAITFWFFIALSIGALFIYRKVNKKDLFRGKGKKDGWKAFGLFMIGFVFIAILAFITYFTSGRQTVDSLRNANKEVSISNVKVISMLVIGGFFASAAMVTPGMSGALVLLVFGAYGHLYSGLYSHVDQHPWILLMYICGSVAGTITSVVILDKAYKKWPFIISWIFYGTIAFSIIAMAWIFDVFIPADPIRWIYIAIGFSFGIGLSVLTIHFVKPHPSVGI